jgi:GTP cyclohydrolase II
LALNSLILSTVGIDSFTLITNNPEAQIEDAKAIMRAKVIVPLAMQKT